MKTIKTMAVILVITLLSSCHMSKKNLEKQVAKSFTEKTNTKNVTVTLIKSSEHKYEGTVYYTTFFGNPYSKDIVVNVDVDDPSQFEWEIHGALY